MAGEDGQSESAKESMVIVPSYSSEQLQVMANAAFRGAFVANKPLLTIDEATMFLGISNRYLRRLIADGKLRIRRLGEKRILIDRADLLRLPQFGPAPR